MTSDVFKMFQFKTIACLQNKQMIWYNKKSIVWNIDVTLTGRQTAHQSCKIRINEKYTADSITRLLSGLLKNSGNRGVLACERVIFP